MIFPWIYFLKEDDQLLVEGFTNRRVVNGPGIFVPNPFERVRKRKGIGIEPTKYLRITNKLSGNCTMKWGRPFIF